MKKKMPTRRSTEQYWTEAQFQHLQEAPPGKLASRGPMPWRLLAYLLSLSPDVIRLRSFVRKRLMPPKQLDEAEQSLKRMLLTLWAGDFIELEPEPPIPRRIEHQKEESAPETAPEPASPPQAETGLLGSLLAEANITPDSPSPSQPSAKPSKPASGTDKEKPSDLEMYQPRLARANESLQELLQFRSVHPLFARFMVQNFDLADEGERIQLLESVLEVPNSIVGQLKYPGHEELPPGPLAIQRLDEEILARGLATAEELQGKEDAELKWERTPPMPIAQKLRLLFRSEYPEVHDVRINPVWIAGDLLRFGGNFDNYIRSRDLAKQEGLIFRHVLRLILLCGEFAEVCPPGWGHADWKSWLNELSGTLTESCRQIDPDSTDKAIESAQEVPDIVQEERP